MDDLGAQLEERGAALGVVDVGQLGQLAEVAVEQGVLLEHVDRVDVGQDLVPPVVGVGVHGLGGDDGGDEVVDDGRAQALDVAAVVAEDAADAHDGGEAQLLLLVRGLERRRELLRRHWLDGRLRRGLLVLGRRRRGLVGEIRDGDIWIPRKR